MARLILAFVGRRYSTPETGHDDWASKETYEWLAANGSAVTRIGDISGEHAKDLGHPRSHTRGKDLDIFHYYTVPGTRNTRAGEGQDNYNRLVTAVGEAYFGNQDASLQVENWILATRGGLDALLATNNIRIIIYAKGSGLVAPGITFPRGWAESRIKTGKFMVGTQPFDTRMGTWGQNESRILYFTDHNDHVHVSLAVR